MAKKKGFLPNTPQVGELTDITWDESYSVHYYIACELYRNAFKLEGLPTNIRENYVYDQLGNRGSIAFVNDAKFGLNAFPYAKVGQFNEYGYPTEIRVLPQGRNRSYWTSKAYTYKDFIIMRNNGTERAIYPMLSFYAKQLASAAIENDNLAKSLKVLCMIISDKTMSFDSENIANAFNRNAQFFEYVPPKDTIIGSDSKVAPPIIPVTPRVAPGTLQEVQQYINQIKNDLYQLLGLGSVSMQKMAQMNEKELTLTDKVNTLSAASIVDERQKACDAIESKWGYKITSTTHPALKNISGAREDTGGDTT